MGLLSQLKMKHLLVSFLLFFSLKDLGLEALSLERNYEILQCPFNEPIIVGNIQDPDLVETSGLVASHQYPGVYYSIQDSLNPSNVYVTNEDGTSLGKFDLEGIEQDDWEDITILKFEGIDYIHIGDTGNNYDGHCRGIDYADMRVIRFPEPEIEKIINGLKTIPSSDITIMTLKNPNQPEVCDDATKQDFETLMADHISGDIYMPQKNMYTSDVTLYKFTPTKLSETIMMEDLGKLTALSNDKKALGPYFDWPMAITGGDISRGTNQILIRNYPHIRKWDRNDGQSVEDAILGSEPCEFTLIDEPLGESVAIKADESGFITTSDEQVNAPLYFYEYL